LLTGESERPFHSIATRRKPRWQDAQSRSKMFDAS